MQFISSKTVYKLTNIGKQEQDGKYTKNVEETERDGDSFFDCVDVR